MEKPFGRIRLPALPTPDVRHALTTESLFAARPRSSVTVLLDAARLTPGDVAGLALFSRPFAWLGVECGRDGLSLAQFDGRLGQTRRIPLKEHRVWLRVECDFARNSAGFCCRTDGERYVSIGGIHAMGEIPAEVYGIPCSLFCCAPARRSDGGSADFFSFVLATAGAPLTSASPRTGDSR